MKVPLHKVLENVTKDLALSVCRWHLVWYFVPNAMNWHLQEAAVCHMHWANTSLTSSFSLIFNSACLIVWSFLPLFPLCSNSAGTCHCLASLCWMQSDLVSVSGPCLAFGPSLSALLCRRKRFVSSSPLPAASSSHAPSLLSPQTQPRQGPYGIFSRPTPLCGAPRQISLTPWATLSHIPVFSSSFLCASRSLHAALFPLGAHRRCVSLGGGLCREAQRKKKMLDYCRTILLYCANTYRSCSNRTYNSIMITSPFMVLRNKKTRVFLLQWILNLRQILKVTKINYYNYNLHKCI